MPPPDIALIYSQLEKEFFEMVGLSSKAT